jgi:hypothetical protein
MGQRVTFSGEANRFGEPQGNRVLIGRPVAGSRPETARSIHGQVESGVILTGGPNQPPLKRRVDELWIGVKG